MSQNWMRHFELQLVDSDGNGLDFGEFKVNFTVNWFNISSETKLGTFKIYNLAQETVNKIMGEEFKKIRVIAGYDGIAAVVDESQVSIARNVDPEQLSQTDGRNYGLLFEGDIRYALTGNENQVDSYVLIQAADSDRAFSQSFTSYTLSAGYTVADIDRVLMKDFARYGVLPGRTPVYPPTVFPRGRVLFGMTRDLMDNVARQCGATWMMVDGKREMVAHDEVVHEAIILNTATGLIGTPQQTIGHGINVRALINPNIRINGLIQLDQALIMRTEPKTEEPAKADQNTADSKARGNVTAASNTGKPPANNNNQPAVIATDGVYKVTGIMYTGETRGQPWYMDLQCQARGTDDLNTQQPSSKQE